MAVSYDSDTAPWTGGPWLAPSGRGR